MLAIFDLVGTLVTLEPLEERLRREGAPEGFLDGWFAELLQTAMAATLAQNYLPFRQAAELSLTNLLEKRGMPGPPVPEVMAAFAALPPAAGVRQCLERLQERGVRRAVLTNSSRDAAETLLEKGGVRELFQAVLSVDEVGACKPHPDTYRMALDRLDCEPEEAWMIAAHGWDIFGAAGVGMHTIWIMNRDRRWPFPGLPPGATVTGFGDIPSLVG